MTILTGKFAPAQRLLRQDNFTQVLQSAAVADKCFKIFYLNNGRDFARLGIVVSKKVLPRAIDRNRAKRKIREAFRLHQVKLCQLDVVVMVRHGYAQFPESKFERLPVLLNRLTEQCVKSSLN